MNKIVIFDIDGTIANIDHRLHLVADREKFHESAPGDTIVPQVNAVLLAFSRYYYCVFFTGRSDKYRQITEQWILDHTTGASFDLYMRKDGDKRLDAAVKEEMLEKLLRDRPGWEVFAVFEDRKSVCEMWNRRGVFCFDVAQGKGDF